jgi:hypothetical protein
MVVADAACFNDAGRVHNGELIFVWNMVAADAASF